MTKPVCCLLLALGLAACTAPKAIVLDEPATTGTRGKPANRTSPGPVGPQEPQAPPLVNQQSGMRINEDSLLKLPDKKDMTPTAPVGPGGGGSGVTATPPTADKRGE
jgi:hypothetical protein